MISLDSFPCGWFKNLSFEEPVRPRAFSGRWTDCWTVQPLDRAHGISSSILLKSCLESTLQVQAEQWLLAETLIKSLMWPLLPLRATHQPVLPSQPWPSSVSKSHSCPQQYQGWVGQSGSLSTKLTKLPKSYFLAACCADKTIAEHPFSELMHKSLFNTQIFSEWLRSKHTMK